MPRHCSICIHPQREAIDQALINNVPFQQIADFNGLSKTALIRHKQNGHISAALIQAQAIQEVNYADSLMAEIQDLQARTLAILAMAETKADLKIALEAIRTARGNHELIARLQGLLTANGVQVIVNQYQANIMAQSKEFSEFKQWKIDRDNFENMTDEQFDAWFKAFVQASGPPPLMLDAVAAPQGCTGAGVTVALTEEAGMG